MTEQRTPQQRKAIEKYCSMVAQAMNDAGHSVQTAFTADVAISQENIKESMFKVVMIALYPDAVDEDGKPTTTKLTTDQVTHVYENMNRITSERYGVGMDFPSHNSQLNESLIKK